MSCAHIAASAANASRLCEPPQAFFRLPLGKSSLFTGTPNEVQNKMRMSAYSSRSGSQIISLPGSASYSGPPESRTNEVAELHIQGLPQIAYELEAFLGIARQLEGSLHQERAQTRKFREELKDLQIKHSRFVSEAEGRMKAAGLAEERIKAQLIAQQESEKSRFDQINSLCKEIEGLREEKQKNDIELEILKANLENSKQAEMSMKASLNSIQKGEKTRVEQAHQLSQELSQVRAELGRYQNAWKQIAKLDENAKQVIREQDILRKKLEEQTQKHSLEKRRREELEEVLYKERREKQIALSCFHTAESRLNALKREAEEEKTKQHQNTVKNINDRGLILKF
jgi:chromosome segregation ATPase